MEEENKLMVVKPEFKGTIEAKIKQLGEIESNIQNVKEFAQNLKDYYSFIVFDEDSMKTAKEEKAKINKFKDEVANYRKNIIKQWKEPIDQFETLSKETEKILTEAYDTINLQCNKFDENKKLEKENNLKDFFDEYCKSSEIDFITFSDVGLNITLFASEKSLKKQIIAYIDKVNQDLKVIDSQENRIEILSEYKQCLDLNKAILIVSERKKRLDEELKKQQELVNKRLEEETKSTAEALQNFVPNDEEIVAPRVIEITKTQDTEKKYKMTFTVNGTMEQLKALKEYLKKEGLINE